MSAMPIGKFEYGKSKKDGKWYFRLKAANGKIIAPSQRYETERGCINGINSVKWNSQGPICKLGEFT